MLKNFIDIERLIHSIKTTIACLIGLLLSNFIGFSGGQWVVITIIVVMCAQIYVGSVFQKAYLRFLGTLIGCIFAIIALTTLGATFWAAAVAIGISSFCFSYAATAKESLTYAGTLGAATTAIIMLGQNPSVLLAGERFLEISLGILIATLISQFVLPIHASTHIRRSQAKTLTALRDYYQRSITATDKVTSDEDLEENIINLLTKQRQLAIEAKREPLTESFDQQFFMNSLYCEKEILRSIDFMHIALLHFRDRQGIFSRSPAFHQFNETVVQSLNIIIQVIENKKTDLSHIHLPAWIELQKEIEKDQSISLYVPAVYVQGFLFAAEKLVSCIKQLADLYKIPYYSLPKD